MSGGVEATAREIVRALHAIPRLKIETPRCIGCQKPWTDDHNHDALHAEWPDDIIMLVKQEVYHYERDTEAEVALIADRLRAAPPSGLTPPREALIDDLVRAFPYMNSVRVEMPDDSALGWVQAGVIASDDTRKAILALLRAPTSPVAGAPEDGLTPDVERGRGNAAP